VVILITEHLSDVIPTIKSRCQLVRFSEIPPSVKKEQLLKKRIPEELTAVFAHLSGSLETDGEADDGGKIKHYESVVHQVKEWGARILSGSPDALLTLSESWLLDEVKEGRAWFLLDVLLLFYRDLLMVSLKGETEIFRDSGIERLSMRHSPGKIMLAMDNVLIARRLLVRPQLNWQGIFEQMIVAVSEERLSMKNGWELIPLSKV
jgi:DNA polymerase III subunit delta'